MKTMLFVLALTACSRPVPETLVPESRRTISSPTPVAPKPVAVAEPSDEQIFRDASIELDKWRAVDHRVRNPIITKENDKFEKDLCSAFVTGKTNGGTVRVFLSYRRHSDYWKLSSLTSRIFFPR